jgi:hypothetical protein
MRRYPSLEDCVARSVRFEALSDADAAAWLSQHPLYRDVSPAVIRYVNRNFAHGSLRAWKRFTRDAAEMCDQTGEPLTHEIANTVFALQRGAQLLDEHDQGENDP